jgi:hypothetical protein
MELITNLYSEMFKKVEGRGQKVEGKQLEGD